MQPDLKKTCVTSILISEANAFDLAAQLIFFIVFLSGAA
jgi:hypothetical protein